MAPGKSTNSSGTNSSKKNNNPNVSKRDSMSSPVPRNTSEQKKKKQNSSTEDNVDVTVTVDPLHGLPPKHKNSINHRNHKECPCGKSGEAECWMIDCSKCHQFWHVDCVSLNGLGEKAINKLVDYLCPFCYVPPVPISYAQFDTDVCLFCRSTLTLQMANNLTETAISTKKLKTISSFSKEIAKIDFESVKNGLIAVQDLDLHMKHLLINQDDLKGHQIINEKIEANLNKIIERTDTPSYTKESIDSLSQNIQQLQGQIDALISSPTQQTPLDSTATDQLLARISQQLDVLSSQSLPSVAVSEPAHTSPPPPCTSSPKQSHREQPIHLNRENYIEPELENQLLEYFESSKDKFHTEGERLCLSFGEQYKYSGSRSSAEPSETPILLQQLIDRINSDFVSEGQPKINSCLVNCYQGADSSLPQHSDDEQSIHPESLIHTISLGATCSMTFMAKHTRDYSQEHVCQPRSIYSMTRRSQEFFSHGISKGSIDGKRYSITFRSVSFRNRNSTCIIGDSNTCGLKFGSDPKKSFGQWMPGRQVFTPVIDDIDPYVACGYKNIVVHCAINDLKKEEVKNFADIKRVFSLYVNKIEHIQAVNPRAHVYICPPLPSKRAELNRKSLYFIKLIREELLSSNFGVTMVDGFDGFLDQAGLLSQHLSRNLNRYQKPDYLHLNWKGVAKLGVLIRNTVLLRMNGGTDRRRRSQIIRNNGQMHAGVTDGYAGAVANGFGHNHDGYQS